jgi:hypothetical protein
MFAFAEQPPKNKPPDSQVILDPKSTVLIRGWYRNNDESEEFLVTDYAKSAAAELKQSGANIGTITAVFSAAWPKNGQPPADEPKPRSAEAATGRGQRFNEKYIEVERNVGGVRAVISVRYNR